MIIDLIIYVIVTTLAMKFAAPWLTSGKAAFAVREKNSLVMRVLAIGLITVVYFALSISMNMAAPLLGAAIVAVLSQGMTAAIVYALAFAALDVLAMAITIKGASVVMKKTLKVDTFGAAVCASLLIIAVATIAQTATAVAVLSLSAQ
jgi:hypothetical protein